MLHSTRIYKATIKNRKLGKKKRSVPVSGLAENEKGKVLFTVTNSRWDSISSTHETHAEYLMLKRLRNNKSNSKVIKLCITVQPCSKCLDEIRLFNKEQDSKVIEITYLFDNSWKNRKAYLKDVKDIDINLYKIKEQSEKEKLYKLAKIFTNHQDRSKKRYNPSEEELKNYESTKQATLNRFR